MKLIGQNIAFASVLTSVCVKMRMHTDIYFTFEKFAGGDTEPQ